MHKLDIVVVSYKTPALVEILIKSFQKFVTNKNFSLNFIIVENSTEDMSAYLKEKIDCSNVTVVNNPVSLVLSQAHASGLEFAKSYLTGAPYVFTCHSDTCVTDSSFFDELEYCINDDVSLAGVCEDAVAIRVKALHCSGLLVKSGLYKKVSMNPNLPEIDTADLLTVFCRDNNLKMRLFRNTYNDKSLVSICNSPFKELGEDCGVDRCLDSKNNVMFIHQGRGTTKYAGLYTNYGKLTTDRWVSLCKNYI